MKSTIHTACAVFFLAAAGAQAGFLDFESPNICSSNTDGSGAFTACIQQSYINQGYGDDTDVDVTYNDGLSNSLRLWLSGWVGLASYAPYGVSPTIDIVPLNGASINGVSFYLTPYLTPRNLSYVDIYEFGGPLLQSFGPQTLTTATQFSYNTPTTVGYRIAFGSSQDVAIDNASFTVVSSGVPEPATAGIAAAALAVGTFLLRRRRG
jgi:hypothetical protein